MKFVTPRKEKLEFGAEMRIGKKIRVSYFLIIGKETSSREIGKETWVELGKMGKLRKKCFNTTKLSETCK